MSSNWHDFVAKLLAATVLRLLCVFIITSILNCTLLVSSVHTGVSVCVCGHEMGITRFTTNASAGHYRWELVRPASRVRLFPMRTNQFTINNYKRKKMPTKILSQLFCVRRNYCPTFPWLSVQICIASGLRAHTTC